MVWVTKNYKWFSKVKTKANALRHIKVEPVLKIGAHFSKLFGSISIEGADSLVYCPDLASIGCIEIYYRLEYTIFFTSGSIVYN